MADDHRRKSKSRNHDGSGRSKEKNSSSRGGRDRRHRDEDRNGDRDSGRHKERDRDSRDHKSTRGKDDDRSRESKLTEEEEKLYAKAREYVKREGKDNRRQTHDHHNGKDSKRRRCSESYESSDSEANASREEKRHRSHRKEHKRSNKNDDRHDKPRHKKKSTRNHRDKAKQRHKNHGSKSEESFKDKASPIDLRKLVSLGDVIREPPAEQLDPETNYFSHNSHLRLFLYRQFGIYFEDLTSSESHDAFKEFIKSYNAGKLERAYHDLSGLLPQDALDQCSRTKHQWKFRTNRVEEQSLEMVRAGVKKQTEYNKKGGVANNASAATGTSLAYPITRMKNEQGEDNLPRRRTPQEIGAQRQSDKQHGERIKLANEEIYGVGKADSGWERQREKKREQSEKLHGAAMDRDGEAWGGAELNDDTLYGTAGVGGRGRGEASYGEAVEKKRRYRERKEAEKASRLSELLKKEEEKQKNMLAMLGLSGLKAGQKITIAPRND